MSLVDYFTQLQVIAELHHSVHILLNKKKEEWKRISVFIYLLQNQMRHTLTTVGDCAHEKSWSHHPIKKNRFHQIGGARINQAWELPSKAWSLSVQKFKDILCGFIVTLHNDEVWFFRQLTKIYRCIVVMCGHLVLVM